MIKDAPTQNTAPEIDDDDLFSFGPALKKRRNSPEEELQQSVKDEFLSFYEEAIKKRRKFVDFWALYKKVSCLQKLSLTSTFILAISTYLPTVQEDTYRASKHWIRRASLFSACNPHKWA